MERTHAPRPASDLFNAVGHLSLKQLEVFQVIQDTPDGMQAVSYTHLTLPTICSV